MRRSLVFAAAGGLVIATALTACSSETPVVLGSGYEVCISSDAEMVTFGDVAQASDAAAVLMDSVELVDPEGLELRESYLVPIENTTSLGTDAYPPDPEVWDRRIDVRGTVVDAGTDMTVLFAVAPVGGGDVHRSSGYVLRYWLDGRLVEARSDASFVVAPDCATIEEVD
ncbi:hypothetical protein ACIGEP_13575 [Microbacterium sp. NPDC077663]|uniref:hypothetical protein n=1 Tax=Microbacterium sp. NPDC077663 TaxID=3364189 RepID=UPI0037C912C6